MAKTRNPVAVDLREKVESREGPDDRTIIVFEYVYEMSGKKKDWEYYTFVAVWIEDKGRWFCSGIGNGVPREADNDTLMKILASKHVKSASVVTEVEAFKP
jgi:hypothetical protein